MTETNQTINVKCSIVKYVILLIAFNKRMTLSQSACLCSVICNVAAKRARVVQVADRGIRNEAESL